MAAVAAAASNKPKGTPLPPPLESTEESRKVKMPLIVELQTPESFDLIRA